ncbi:MAG: metal-dependent hydrolase [bacterium]
MPSPVGHSLIGLAIGAGYLLPRQPARDLVKSSRAMRWSLLGAAALANVSDLDYLPGMVSGDLNAYHHLYTHTIGWVVLVAVATWLVRRWFCSGAGWRVFAFVFALLASHLVADWFTADGRLPYGIMALWPFSNDFTMAPWPVFMRLYKREWSEFLQWHNALAVGWEVLVCAPMIAAAAVWKTRLFRDATWDVFREKQTRDEGLV